MLAGFLRIEQTALFSMGGTPDCDWVTSPTEGHQWGHFKELRQTLEDPGDQYSKFISFTIHVEMAVVLVSYHQVQPVLK